MDVSKPYLDQFIDLNFVYRSVFGGQGIKEIEN